MPFKTGSLIGILGALSLLLPAVCCGFFDLPRTAPPDEYGNILIDRTATRNNVRPVTFSHWQHRMKYTCRVCHSELEFNMKVNTTEITESAIRKGKFCGACHNGRIAFRSVDNCDKCHNGMKGYGREKFAVFFQSPFPRTEFGNGINWVEALRRKMINPATYLKTKPQDIPFDKNLLLEAEWTMIPPAVFPHKEHMEWLDCNICHPDIFNIKKKSTKHFAMSYILKGQFCGVCHLTVAFPMDDCKRCHPDGKERK